MDVVRCVPSLLLATLTVNPNTRPGKRRSSASSGVPWDGTPRCSRHGPREVAGTPPDGAPGSVLMSIDRLALSGTNERHVIVDR